MNPSGRTLPSGRTKTRAIVSGRTPSCSGSPAIRAPFPLHRRANSGAVEQLEHCALACALTSWTAVCGRRCGNGDSRAKEVEDAWVDVRRLANGRRVSEHLGDVGGG